MVLLLTLVFQAPPPVSATTLCWERDVLPVVRVECGPCHLAGSPMYRLDSLPLVLKRKAKWQAYLQSGHMPPAGKLSPALARGLVDWMNGGGPKCAP